MHTITVRTAAACILACVAASPAAAQNREHQQMAAELRILQEQTQQISVALAEALTQLTGAIARINARLDESDAATRKSLADQKVIIDGVSTELRVLRERTQDTNTRIGTLAEEIEAMRIALPSLTTQAFPVDPLDPLAGGGAVPASPLPGPSGRSGLSPTRLFQTAYSDYASGDYTLAISGFEAYLSEFPRFEHADDAHLFIGMSHKNQKKHTEAIAAFNMVIQNYPAGDKVPEAYFRLGETQNELRQTEAARTAWNTLLARFPDHAFATLAKQRLEGLPALPPRQP